MFAEQGRDLPEGLKAAKYLADAGYDALNVDVGCYDAHYWNHPSVYQRDGLYLEAAAKVKKVVNIPVIVAGRMDNPALGEAAVTLGQCDLIALGDMSADPDCPIKCGWASRRVRPCIGCNYGCCTKVHLSAGKQGCAVNAQAANELSRILVRRWSPKKLWKSAVARRDGVCPRSGNERASSGCD